ncbi:MAG: RNA polymerase sigma factor [Pseudomonadota bacterium]
MSGFAGLNFDTAIVSRAQRGDRRALDLVCRQLASPVYTLCYRLCQSQATAEDLTQETFVEVLRHLPKFRGEASLATWVRTIAVSRCMMFFRSAWQRRATALDEAHEPASDATEQLGLARDLGDALGRLNESHRVVVWLYDVEGYTHREIADLTGKTESYSKSCLSRARAELRRWLDTAVATPAPAATLDTRCIA